MKKLAMEKNNVQLIFKLLNLWNSQFIFYINCKISIKIIDFIYNLKIMTS